jgi:hypothetical protein
MAAGRLEGSWMKAPKRYVLDANVFIQAHRTCYSFDFCPGFWLALVRQHEANRVFSIDKVEAEMRAGRDRLAQWIKNEAPVTFFKGTADKAVSDAFSRIANWVQSNQQFKAEAKQSFLSGADGWVIAYAQANTMLVVTHEELAPEAKTKVPIPNVCAQFGVDYCNTYDMLRDLKVQFILKGRRRPG